MSKPTYYPRERLPVKRNTVAHYVLMYLKFAKTPVTPKEISTFSPALSRCDHAIRSLEKQGLILRKNGCVHLLPDGIRVLHAIAARNTKEVL